MGAGKRKIKYSLDRLLDDSQILNSEAPKSEDDEEKDKAPQSIQFVVRKVISKNGPSFKNMLIELESPVTVDKARIEKIFLSGDKVQKHYRDGDFAVGN